MLNGLCRNVKERDKKSLDPPLYPDLRQNVMLMLTAKDGSHPKSLKVHPRFPHCLRGCMETRIYINIFIYLFFSFFGHIMRQNKEICFKCNETSARCCGFKLKVALVNLRSRLQKPQMAMTVMPNSRLQTGGPQTSGSRHGGFTLQSQLQTCLLYSMSYT